MSALLVLRLREKARPSARAVQPTPIFIKANALLVQKTPSARLVLLTLLPRISSSLSMKLALLRLSNAIPAAAWTALQTAIRFGPSFVRNLDDFINAVFSSFLSDGLLRGVPLARWCVVRRVLGWLSRRRRRVCA
jgi:hypothetical protein